MIGNPLVDSMDEETWRREAVKRLGNLKNLDGQTILRAEDEWFTEFKNLILSWLNNNNWEVKLNRTFIYND